MPYATFMKTRHKILERHEEPATFTEVLHCMIDTINETQSAFFVNFLAVEFTYSEKVSNSHSAPMHHPTNWCARNKQLPTHFPGWEGRGWVCYERKSKHHSYWISDVLEAVGFCTGTGGGGTYDFTNKFSAMRELRHKTFTPDNMASWDCRIWEDDWPGLILANLLVPTQREERIQAITFDKDYHRQLKANHDAIQQTRAHASTAVTRWR